jgi:hypothetical protein
MSDLIFLLYTYSFSLKKLEMHKDYIITELINIPNLQTLIMMH